MHLARVLADSLRRLRDDPKLTQAEMAKRLEISRPTLTRLESVSQNVTIKTFRQLCQSVTDMKRSVNNESGDLYIGR